MGLIPLDDPGNPLHRPSSSSHDVSRTPESFGEGRASPSPRRRDHKKPSLSSLPGPLAFADTQTPASDSGHPPGHTSSSAATAATAAVKVDRNKSLARFILPSLNHSFARGGGLAAPSPSISGFPPGVPLPTDMFSSQSKDYFSANPADPFDRAGIFAPQSPAAIYIFIHQLSAKRISTLNYLRKAYDSQVHWFNSVHFSKADVSRLPQFSQKRLPRRAANFLVLGLSLPAILELSPNLLDYLRALNSLLSEFEAFQQCHPADGSASAYRARLPSVFKRSAGGRARRPSSNDVIFPGTDVLPLSGGSGAPGSSVLGAAGIGDSSAELLPGEEYMYLLAPSLPFEPDFFQTFATLCEVIMDCYLRIVKFVSTLGVCTPVLGDLFLKADAKIRKVMVSGIVREFEDASRAQTKSEMVGINRVVLGGMMG